MNIVGDGGLSRQILDVIDTFHTYSITYGGKVRGWITSEYEDEDAPYVIGFASLEDGKWREEEFDKLVTADRCIGTIISPRAQVSSNTSSIKSGTVILHNAFVGPGVKLEENVLIGTGAIVEHDSTIEAHTVVLTGAIINGGCLIGKRCMIGSGAIILQNITITDDVRVGAGAVVTSNLDVSGTYVGCPAERIK